MLRTSCLVAFCLVFAMAGCRKKEEEKPQVQQQKPKVTAPEGMAHISGTKPPAFITKKPVAVGEYVQYLQETGQDVPEALAGADAISTEAVTGLTLKEAERFAACKLARLPNATEWAKATDVVGAGPYLWGDETAADEPREGAALYLVRDWVMGSATEQKAKQVKAALLTGMLENQVAQINTMKEQMRQALQDGVASAKEEWKKIKPQLFAVAQQEKELAQIAAAGRYQKVVLEVLDKVGQEKKKLIGVKFKDQVTKEELDKAFEEYKQFLAQQRNNVEPIRAELQKKNKQLSDRALELKKRLEAAGEQSAGAIAMAGERIAEAVPEKIETLKDAAAARAEIVRAKKDAQDLLDLAAAGYDKLARDLGARAEELKKKLATAKADEALAKKIEQVQTSLASLNKNLGAQFEQEPHLFKDLKELTDARALKDAMQAEIEELENALTLFGLTTPEREEQD